MLMPRMTTFAFVAIICISYSFRSCVAGIAFRNNVMLSSENSIGNIEDFPYKLNESLKNAIKELKIVNPH